MDENYDVLADGEVVGRILEEGSRFGPPELRWGWSITAIVPATPGVTNGTAATREEAMGEVMMPAYSPTVTPEQHDTRGALAVRGER
jgi:hypothetical protein